MEKELDLYKESDATESTETLKISNVESDNGEQAPQVKKRKMLTRLQKLKIFYAVMLIFPILHTTIFYFYINFATIAMAFTKYEQVPNGIGYIQKFAGFANFKTVFDFLSISENAKTITNSVVLSFFKLLLGSSITLVFSFYVYKKFLLGGFFRIILFLPNLISGLLMVELFKYMVTDIWMEIFGAQVGLLDNTETKFGSIVFYTLWLGLATQILMYSSAMSGINESIVESAQLDGITPVKEFIFITVPMIFPTLVTFISTGLAATFVDQMSLYVFYAGGAPSDIRTLGYLFYITQLGSSIDPNKNFNFNSNNKSMSYPELTAFGLLTSLVTVPVVVTVKSLLQKYGPSAN